MSFVSVCIGHMREDKLKTSSVERSIFNMYKLVEILYISHKLRTSCNLSIA